ncbi:MAG: hypothetical protein HZA91_06030 [Verrucomicrobia bacterium]|nr:hypothetical protein [Verrucomicrobiota bacterium]
MKFKAVVVTLVALAGALMMNGCTLAPTALGIMMLLVDDKTPSAPVWRIAPPAASPLPTLSLPDLDTAPQHAALDERR